MADLRIEHGRHQLRMAWHLFYAFVRGKYLVISGIGVKAPYSETAQHEPTDSGGES